MAQLRNLEPQLAYVYLPALDEMFVAERGRGLYQNGKRLRLNSRTQINQAMVGFDYKRYLQSQEQEYRIREALRSKIRYFQTFASTAYSIALVVQGKLHAYIQTNPDKFDIGGADLLIQEANGICTTLDGKPFDRTKENSVLIADSNQLHSQLLKLIHG